MTVAELIEKLKEVPQGSRLVNKDGEVVDYSIMEDYAILSGYSEYSNTAMLKEV